MYFSDLNVFFSKKSKTLTQILFNPEVSKGLDSNPDLDVSGMIEAIVTHCEDAFEKDVASNKAMGQFGANHILDKGKYNLRKGNISHVIY